MSYAKGGVVVAVVLLGLSSGCRSVSQAEMKMMETRELDLSYPQAYDAALNGMFSLGLQITHSDKSSGIISGQSGDHVQRANAGIWAGFYPVKKVTLLVSGRGPNRSQLRMKVLVNEEQKLDRKLMTRIWQQIEREAMLETRPVRPRGRARR